MIPRLSRVTVHWKDICVGTDGWTDLAGVTAATHDCQTTGYLLTETEDFLTLIANWGADPEGKVEVNGWTCIPKGCITRVESLEGAG